MISRLRLRGRGRQARAGSSGRVFSGSTDRRRPRVLSTASSVFNVGLPLGDSVR